MKQIQCPYCSRYLVREFARANFLTKVYDKKIKCLNCNNFISIQLAEIAKPQRAVPTGVFLGLLVGNMIYLPIEHNIKIKLMILSAVIFIVGFMILLILTTKIQK